MKSVVGSDMTLKIYISPGGKNHTAWNDEKQKNVKTLTKEPAGWQYKKIRDAFKRVNNEFGITIKEVARESQSDTQIKLTTVPNADAVNGEWIRSWDNSGVTDIYLSMTYQSGLDGSKYPAAHNYPDDYPHDDQEKSEWNKINRSSSGGTSTMASSSCIATASSSTSPLSFAASPCGRKSRKHPPSASLHSSTV